MASVFYSQSVDTLLESSNSKKGLAGFVDAVKNFWKAAWTWFETKDVPVLGYIGKMDRLVMDIYIPKVTLIASHAGKVLSSGKFLPVILYLPDTLYLQFGFIEMGWGKRLQKAATRMRMGIRQSRSTR